MKPEFFLIVDNSVQWFVYVVKAQRDGDGFEAIEKKDYECGKPDFLIALAKTPIVFLHRRFWGNGIVTMEYYGWALSEEEYKKLK